MFAILSSPAELLLVLVLLAAAGSASSKSHGSLPTPCDTSTRSGQTCTLAAASVRPTQFILGRQEVRAKTQRFSEMSVSDLQKYTMENPVPCIVGPGGTFYATDHHHLTAAVMASSHADSDKNVVVLVQNTSMAGADSLTDFFVEMVNNGYVWLLDEKGNTVNPVLLPFSVGTLANDPYRSLAYNVRKAGGYDKVSTPYQDFFWSNFFRQHNLIHIPGSTNVADNFCSVAPYSTKCFGGADEEDRIIDEAQSAAMELAGSASEHLRDLLGHQFLRA